METWCKYTNARIKSLHPLIQRNVADFINHMSKKYDIFLRITQGYRSIAYQDELYAQGRTTPGKVVTNAKGGRSYHNYRLAFDVVEIKDGKPLWENDYWGVIGKEGKNFGFFWGGDFKSISDRPHFQKSFGYTTKKLYDLYISQGKPDVLDLKIITPGRNMEKTV